MSNRLTCVDDALMATCKGDLTRESRFVQYFGVTSCNLNLSAFQCFFKLFAPKSLSEPDPDPGLPPFLHIIYFVNPVENLIRVINLSRNLLEFPKCQNLNLSPWKRRAGSNFIRRLYFLRHTWLIYNHGAGNRK